MVDRFLHAKHWQLFILTFALPVLSYISAAVMIALSIYTDDVRYIRNISILYFPLLTFFSTVVLLSWYWSLAIGLQQRIPDKLKTDLMQFKILFLIPTIYFLLKSILTIFILNWEIGADTITAVFFQSIPERIFLFLNLLSFACLLYGLYFISKTIKTAELEWEVSFSDFSGDFFKLLFYPVGIWSIQPEINNLVKKNKLREKNHRDLIDEL